MILNNPEKNTKVESNNNDEIMDMLKSFFSKHIETLHSASQAYDKAILSLSTATLGFTFGFLELVKPKYSLNLLEFIWGLLIFSIIFILISFIADQIHSANEIKYYTNRIFQKVEE